MLLIAPHLLQQNCTNLIHEWPTADIAPINQLDPTVFRTSREKSIKKKEAKPETQ